MRPHALVACLVLTGCSLPSPEPSCEFGAAVSYVVLVDAMPFGPGTAIDAVSVTDEWGETHWANQRVEAGGNAADADADGAGLLGPPDASCSSGFTRLGSAATRGYVIVGFPITRDEPLVRVREVNVVVAPCEERAAYDVVVMASDHDDSWDPIASATNSLAVSVQSGCEVAERDPERDPEPLPVVPASRP
jgi:hypothetical protein